MLQTTVKNAKEEFDRVFIELGHDSKLEIANKNEVRFFMLDIKNNQYSYYEMFSILHSNLGRYALSRKEFQKDPETAISRGISIFHEVKGSGTGAGGEIGELLLYLFLETVLGAPKLLSKMELKGTRNQYNYNADAVHYFTYKNEYGQHNQLILCESKLIGDFSRAIKDAFDSLTTSIGNKEFDLSLISTEMFKESFSEEEANDIIKQIVPNATDDFKNDIIKETAAGIFIGYDKPIIEQGDSLVVRKQTAENIKKEIPNMVKKINKQIEKYNLKGMSFYIYLLPFNDVDKDRAKIMEQLLTRISYKE